MAVFVNPQGELKEFPDPIEGDIYEEPIIVWEAPPGAPWKGHTRHATMLWRRVEPWDVEDLRRQPFMEDMQKLDRRREKERGHTLGEVYGPAMAIEDQAEADAFFEVLVEAFMGRFNVSRQTAEAQERENLAYYAAYYDPETRSRVQRLFKAIHPVFGQLP